ncbi:MAG TPA: hypothetical protein VF970_15135 [Gemmatimonadales bacterium]
MFDRQYFEKVLPDQLRIMGQQARLVLRLDSGREYDVWSLVAAHEAYVILEVHAGGQEPARSKRWQEEHPDSAPWVFDQLAVPYATISETFLTPKTLSTQSGRPSGFQLPAA